MYGMYPNAEQWRINLSFIALAFLGGVGFFASEKFKKYLTLYYVVVYPVIAFLFIFFFISGMILLIFLGEIKKTKEFSKFVA